MSDSDYEELIDRLCACAPYAAVVTIGIDGEGKRSALNAILLEELDKWGMFPDRSSILYCSPQLRIYEQEESQVRLEVHANGTWWKALEAKAVKITNRDGTDYLLFMKRKHREFRLTLHIDNRT